jgi:hypothetical protein
VGLDDATTNLRAVARIFQLAVRREESPLASLRRLLSDLRQLYTEGGIVIRTPPSGEGEPIFAETVFQPDADVMTFISPEVLRQPSLWQEHRRQLDAFQARLRGWMTFSAALFRTVVASACLWGALTGLSRARMGYLALALAWAVMPMLATVALRLAIIFGVRHFVLPAEIKRPQVASD